MATILNAESLASGTVTSSAVANPNNVRIQIEVSGGADLMANEIKHKMYSIVMNLME